MVDALPRDLAPQLVDVGRAWPATLRITPPTGPLLLRAYCGLIGEPGVGSTGARHPDERRFQNPGDREPVHLGSGVTLLLGWWDEETEAVLALFDHNRRVGRETRWSVQMRLQTLQEARSLAWATQLKENGELAIAMRPEMFAYYLASVQQLVHSGDAVPRDVASSVDVAGQLAHVAESVIPPELAQAEPVRERIRVQADVLLRSPRFRRLVVSAYHGTCAMCGLQLGLVEAAHLWPAANPDSPDTPDNGLCLCANHHRAFDSGLVRVDPFSYGLSVDEDRRVQLAREGLLGGLEGFEVGLRNELLLPDDEDSWPEPQYLIRRYAEEYGEWDAHDGE